MLAAKGQDTASPMVACLACRAGKRKCDKQLPICSRCKKYVFLWHDDLTIDNRRPYFLLSKNLIWGRRAGSRGIANTRLLYQGTPKPRRVNQCQLTYGLFHAYDAELKNEDVIGFFQFARGVRGKS